MTPISHSVAHARLRPTAAAALVCLLSGLHGVALAQAATETTLETVVITGSTRERRLTDVPYAITSVGSEALRNGGPMVNLSESMARVPGLVVANRNNYAQDLQISSRGFGARAGFGVRGLRLYADGIPASMPDGQGQVAHFDLAGAERVEVLRGPFSALYGNSSGGVIALFSKPVRERQFEVGVDAGSFGLRQGRVSIAAPLEGGFDVSASLSSLSIDGFRPQSGADRQLATARLGWKGDHDRVTVTVSDQNQTADDPLGLTRAQFEADPSQTTPEAAQYGTRKVIRQTQAGASWTHQFTDAGPLSRTQVSGYTGSRGVMQFLAIQPGVQTSTPKHGGGLVDFDRKYHGVDARALWHWDTVDLTTGVNVEKQTDDRRGYENFTGTGATQVLGVQGKLRRDETNRADTREAYVQADWTLAADWQASLGVRTGRVRMRVSDAYLSNGDDSGTLDYRYTNPVAGLRWRVNPALTLHVAASRGHESPTLGELAYRPDGTSGFNTDLQAQTSRQFELGAKWREGGVSLDATVFRIDTDQEIGVATNAGGRSSFRNVGRTERFGAELGAGWRVMPGLRAQMALTLLNAQYADDFRTCTGIPCTLTATTNTTTVPAGNRIAGTQPASAYAELAWTTAWSPDAEAAVEWRAQGRTVVNDTNTDYAGGYGLFNLRYSHLWRVDDAGSLQLLARIDNVAGRRVVGSVIVNDGNGRYFEPGAPRSALVSLRYLRRF